MQPSLTQEPPKCSRSIRAVRKPARASRTARNGPAWPLPMTIAWYESMVSPSCAVVMATVIRARKGEASAAADRRRDRLDDARGLRELLLAIGDVMPLRDPSEVGVGGPDRARLVLQHEQADRPVEAGIRIRGQELRAERRVAEGQKSRGPQRDAGIGGELGLV